MDKGKEHCIQIIGLVWELLSYTMSGPTIIRTYMGFPLLRGTWQYTALLCQTRALARSKILISSVANELKTELDFLPELSSPAWHLLELALHFDVWISVFLLFKVPRGGLAIWTCEAAG